jgi:hypothetical protein
MRHPHVTSGGRYPALRTIAVLYLIGSIFVAGLCVWQAVRVFTDGGGETTVALIGPTNSMGGKVMAGVCWLAAGFIGLLVMFAVAEMIKLFIDIEHNTRALAHAGTASAAARAGESIAADGTGVASNGTTVHEGPAIPFVVRDRKLFAGDETAEGALLRGH